MMELIAVIAKEPFDSFISIVREMNQFGVGKNTSSLILMSFFTILVEKKNKIKILIFLK